MTDEEAAERQKRAGALCTKLCSVLSESGLDTIDMTAGLAMAVISFLVDVDGEEFSADGVMCGLIDGLAETRNITQIAQLARINRLMATMLAKNGDPEAIRVLGTTARLNANAAATPRRTVHVSRRFRRR